MSSIPLEVLLQDLGRWKALTPAGRKKGFFLSEHAFLISTGTKKVCEGVFLTSPTFYCFAGWGSLVLWFVGFVVGRRS